MAYGPDYQSGAGKSDAWRKRELNKLIKGLQDGSIKAPLPSDITGPHIRIPKAKNLKDMSKKQLLALIKKDNKKA